MQWNDPNRQEQEQERPLPPYTRVTAIKEYKAQHPHDLPFSCGDKLTVLEPCNVIFWYLAEDAQGRRGVIPINFVQVDTSEDGSGITPTPAPPTPSLPPKHPSPSLPRKTMPPEQPQRKPSPQTIPRSSASALHSQLCHTSSEEQPPCDSPSPPPPMPPKSPRTPCSHNPPPAVPSRSASRVISSPFKTAATSPKRFEGSSNIDKPPPGKKAQRPPIDIDSRPPAPLPPEAFVPMKKKNAALPPPSFQGKYPSNQEFIEKSGWFQPSVEAVLCRKASFQLSVFQTMTTGLFIFKHKFSSTKKYVGKSRNINTELIQMFHRLFDRPENKLSPLELELKYHSSDAEEWYVRLKPVLNSENLDLEEAKAIVQLRTVKPEGLNPSLEFYSQEDWYTFAGWYREYRTKEVHQNVDTAV